MKKQKYKLVNASVNTVSELVSQTLNGNEFYTKESKVIDYQAIDEFTVGELREFLSDGLKVRKNLPWYEVEGALPLIVKNNAGKIFELFGVDGDGWAVDCMNESFGHIDNLTKVGELELKRYAEKAAKYGVE